MHRLCQARYVTAPATNRKAGISVRIRQVLQKAKAVATRGRSHLAARSRSIAVEGGLDLRELRARLGRDPAVILEIGANDGQDTARLLEMFPEATIHCFEPDPRASALFENNVRSDRVRLHPIAIAAHDGDAVFYQSGGAPPGREEEFPDGWHLSGSIRRPKHHLDAHPWCRFDEEIHIQSRTLDSWATDAEVEFVDFIWADVQGAEVDLIRGGTRVLQSTRYLYTEYNDDELYEGQLTLAGLLDILPGWRVETRFKDDVLLANTNFSNGALRALAPSGEPTSPRG